MNGFAPPTRTEETTKKYLDRAKSLLARIPNSYIENPTAGAHPAEAAKWLRDIAPGLRKATVRQYKASLGYYMEFMAEQTPDAADIYLSAASAIREIPAGQLAAARTAVPPRTSSNKQKRIVLKDLLDLTKFMLKPEPDNWSNRTIQWLIAGVASGLRPAEWEGTTIAREEPNGDLVLAVPNAKNTNGRAGAAIREVSVPAGWFADYTRMHIRDLTAWIAGGAPFEQYYHTCRENLRRSVNALWNPSERRPYSLYTGRHQFCANLKQAGANRKQIAKLMGHASDETARKHYGKRRSGYSGHVPKLQVPTATPNPSPSSFNK